MEKEPKERLYDKLYAEKVYTKSYAEFDKQLSAPGGEKRLYDKLYEGKIYTKSFDDFTAQLALKKKEELQPVLAAGSEVSLPAMQTSAASPVKLPDPVAKERIPVPVEVAKTDPLRPSVAQPAAEKSKIGNIPKVEQKPQEAQQVLETAAVSTPSRMHVTPQGKLNVPASNWTQKRSELEAKQKAIEERLRGGKEDDQTHQALKVQNNDLRRGIFNEYYKNNPPSEKPDANMDAQKARSLLYDVQNYGPKRKEKPEMVIPDDCPKGVCAGAQMYPPRNPEYLWKALDGKTTKPPSLVIKEDYGQWKVQSEKPTEFDERYSLLFDTKADAEDYVKAVNVVNEDNASRWLNSRTEYENPAESDMEVEVKKRVFGKLEDVDKPFAKELFEAKTGEPFRDANLAIVEKKDSRYPNGGYWDVGPEGAGEDNSISFLSLPEAEYFKYNIERLGKMYDEHAKAEKKKKTTEAVKLLSKTTRGF